MEQDGPRAEQESLEAFGLEGFESRTLIIGRNGFQDVTPGAPSYMSQMEMGNFLPEDHRQVSLHNRRKHVSDHARLNMYMRGGLSKVIVDDPAYDTWVNGVSFEDKGLTAIVRGIWDVVEEPLEIADIWSGVFGAGLVVLGYNDGKPLGSPVSSASDITWAEAFSRTHVSEIFYGKDPGDSATYRQPLTYMMRVGNPGEDGGPDEIPVHASRVLLVQRNKHVHPVNGAGDLDKAFNDLEDGLGVAWASAEAYYAGASPKMVLKTMKPLVPAQEQKIDKQTREMQSNVRHLVKMLHGMDLQKLTSGADVAEPLEHVVTVFTFLSASTGVPFSKWFRHHLTGGEAIDWANREWDEYIGNRRRRMGRRIVRRLLMSMQKAGMVTAEQARAMPVWSPPRILTREDVARLARNEATAMATAFKGAGMVHKDLLERFQPATREQIELVKSMVPDDEQDEGDDEPETQTERTTGRRQALKRG